MRLDNSISLAAFILLSGCQPNVDGGSEAKTSPAASTAETNTASAPAKTTPCVELDLPGCTAACDAGNMVSCLRLASMFDKVMVTAIPKDPARARAVIEKACAKRFGPACEWLSHLLHEGRGGPKDDARAGELHALALEVEPAECEHGVPQSCADLSFDYSMGSGVKKDRAKADELDHRDAALTRDACDAGDANACGSYGILISDDDPKASLGYTQKGCDGGDPFACSALARVYKAGVGVPKDAEKARSMREKACKGGLTSDC